eukprot:s1793_g10.t1
MDKRGLETYTRLEAQWKGEVLFTLQDVRKGDAKRQEWLQGLFAQHDRAGHTERQALLEVILEIISSIRRLERQSHRLERLAQRESMRLFVCHFCCISCMAAICNFVRRFPHIQIHIDYDDVWKTRLLDI